MSIYCPLLTDVWISTEQHSCSPMLRIKRWLMAPQPRAITYSHKDRVLRNWHEPCPNWPLSSLIRTPTSIPVRHIFLYPFTTKPGKTFFDYRAVQILTPYRIVRTPHTLWQSPPNSAKFDIRAWQRSYLRRVETSQLDGVSSDMLQQPWFSEFSFSFLFCFKIQVCL